jgi:hypothetical protein
MAHAGVLLDVLHVTDDDYAMAMTVAELLRAGAGFGVAAAVHLARL